MRSKFLLAISFLTVLFPLISVADEPEVTIRPPKSYYAKKVIMFPLEIPTYALKIATVPIGITLKAMEDYGVVNRTLDLLSNKERTFWVYPIIEGGAGSGFGGGIGLKHSDLFHKGYLVGASYKVHIDMTQNANLSFAKPEAFTLFGRPVSYSIGSNFRRTLGDNYFGIGNSTSKENQSQYSSNSISAGATLAYQPVDTFSFTPYLGIDTSDSWSKGNNGSSYPSVQDVFPLVEIDGFRKWVDYMVLGIRISQDTRDNIEMTESGGLYSFTFQRYQGFNRDGFNYNHYELEAKHFFKLFMPRQVLVLRADLSLEDPDDGNMIPFWKLTTLDAGSPLRGFVSGRFRDRGSVLFNIEYRFPIWGMLDGVIFYDTGRVFHDISNISLNHIKYSAGGGLYFRIPNLAFFKLQGAYGGEGANFMFGAGKPL